MAATDPRGATRGWLALVTLVVACGCGDERSHADPAPVVVRPAPLEAPPPVQAPREPAAPAVAPRAATPRVSLVEEARLSPRGARPAFATSVDLDGDLLVAGGWNGPGDRGLVVLFERAEDGEWAEVARAAGRGGRTSYYAHDLAFAGHDIAMCVYSIARSGFAGELVLLGRDGARLTERARFPGEAAEDYFCGGLAAAADRVAVAAAGSGGGNGSIERYAREEGSWRRIDSLPRPYRGPPNYDYPSSLAFDTDGSLFAGVMMSEVAPGEHGGVYAFGWSDIAAAPASVTAPGLALFGREIAIQHGVLAVGATGNGGAVQVFTYSPGPPATFAREAHIRPPRSEHQTLFGSSLAIAGDVLVVADPAAGAAMVHQRMEGEWQVVQTIDVPRSGFEVSLSIDGDRVAIGMPTGTTADEPGAVVVYRIVRTLDSP